LKAETPISAFLFFPDHIRAPSSER
jgi:hypothetical protein